MDVSWQTILSLAARHGLTWLAGILAAHGYLSSSATEQFISAGMLVAGIVWSWWQKRGQALTVLIATRAYNDALAQMSHMMAVKGKPSALVLEKIAAKMPPAPSVTNQQ